MNANDVSREAVVLALQMGMISTARNLFDRYHNDYSRLDEADADLEKMLMAAEGVEAEYGRGALLDLDHPTVNYFIERGQVGSGETKTANLFGTTRLTVSSLDEFVPGLKRHLARQLRK